MQETLQYVCVSRTCSNTCVYFSPLMEHMSSETQAADDNLDDLSLGH